MKELKTVEDLAKAAGQLAGQFTKNAEYHKAAAAQHSAMHAHHESHAAFHKAAHAAMDDGHEMKAHVGKVHEHHVAKAAHHKAMADHHTEAAGAAKAMAAAFGAEPEVKKDAPVIAAAAGDDSMTTLLKQALNENITSLKDDPEFREALKSVVKSLALEQVKSVFGGTIQPSGARKVFGETHSGADADRIQLIHRAGGGPTEEEKGSVPAEMEDALAI